MTSNPFADIVLDGSLLLAAPVALLAGLVSFLSPCVLPLVPGYLGYVTGLTGADLKEHRRGRVVLGVLLFVLGFSVVFIAAGVLFSQATAWLRFNGGWVTQALGLVVIFMGIVFMGGFSWMQRDAKIHKRPPAGLWGAPVLGLTFGLGWAPCIGPTLSAVLIMSTGVDANVGRGALLTVFYCLGLGLPFLLIAFGLQRGMQAMNFFRRHQLLIMRLGGGLLILLGVVMVTGLWGNWVTELQNWFANEVRLPI
ncbi:cytochrome C biogenesis protein CcdA [Glutamicibacter uratoxydans]|uniref:Cytochrome C biogenesis protein CcdA n=1 Tax=Glutamicibacter uratoxydans TaxID=43667 RepID=A0A4Y4DS55_GLUUR|nr:cytochrome c biogenesis CcdA family protein [Glutamicibacter uratoxydans]GED05341.1 cytochrome C biogenesis protein CcdA [Glutamicibacter uratoxydans]